MSLLRRIPTPRLLLLCAAVLAFSAGVTAIASALTAGGPVPAAESLAVAIRQAIDARPVPGITARIEYTNHLIDPGVVDTRGLPGNPLLNGATGRLWLAPGHGLRLELQSSRGDSQLVVHDGAFWAYDAGSNTAYQGSLPRRDGAAGKPKERHAPPSLAVIQRHIDELSKHANVSGAQPGDVAGRPAYTVSVSPRANPGLIGPAQLAWDAVRGIPLRVALYARGSDQPVLELKVTDISFGRVPASVFAVTPPAGAKVVEVKRPNAATARAKARERRGRTAGRRHPAPVSGLDAVQAKLPFRLSAPDSVAGQARNDVKLFTIGNKPVAVVGYGEGLGGIAVIERAAAPAKPGSSAPAASSDGGDGEHRGGLPAVSINGASGHELSTALGTLVTFQRGGVDYVVVGSVTQATAESAARAL
ncbi:MAG: hypothetical protein E6G56_07065 [Actinobacteria bacterium]|nr:MAG: hypothetical protein E6G56_07065 [Actinomycetota bacterium]